MTSDLQALLAAIVADPSDDVARLAYADCLQEHGNSARAEFIRLQVEAARLHPDSNTRAELERQACALFAEHWIKWWGEVTQAVGLPQPTRQPTGRFSRFAQRVGLKGMMGYPYDVGSFAFGCAVRTPIGMYPHPPKLAGWSRADFCGGFPDSLALRLTGDPVTHRMLSCWAAVSPVRFLSAQVISPEFWNDGPHLTGIRALSLLDCDRAAFGAVLRSPNLAHLEDLGWWVTDDEDETMDRFVDHATEMAQYAQFRRLKRLGLQVWTDQTAEAVAKCAHLTGLTELNIDVQHPDRDRLRAGRRVAILASSPYLASLRTLTVAHGLGATGLEPLIQNPTWIGLRKLELTFKTSMVPFDLAPLAGPSNLPALEEVRLNGVPMTYGVIDVLTQSPLLKQLKHFAIAAERDDHLQLADFRRFAQMVDPARIETFAVGLPYFPERMVSFLRAQFGDRLRLLPT